MSLTLAAVADALIEFILSLLRDPEVRAEFEDDPDAALAHRGLSHVSAADVQAVAPVIIERTHVVQVPVIVRQGSPQQHEQHHSSPVVREIQQVSNHFAWVDDRDTIVDQSVNQNIWAEGDVTQTFDNEAVVASGDDAIAGAGDIDVDKTTDQSTTIEAGEDVNIGNDTDVTVVDDSFNDDTDMETTTDGSTDIVVDGSLNDGSTDVQTVDSGNEQTDASATTDVVSAATVLDEAPVEEPVVEEPVEELSAPAPDAGYTDSAVEYTEMESDVEGDDSAFEQTDAVIDESTADDNF